MAGSDPSSLSRLVAARFMPARLVLFAENVGGHRGSWLVAIVCSDKRYGIVLV